MDLTERVSAIDGLADVLGLAADASVRPCLGIEWPERIGADARRRAESLLKPAAECKPGETGAPMLDGALVSFNRRLSSCLVVGSHTVLICEVVGMTEPRSQDGLVYFRRAYHALGPTTALPKGEDG